MKILNDLMDYLDAVGKTSLILTLVSEEFPDEVRLIWLIIGN